MAFIERKEHYIPGKKTDRFVELIYKPRPGYLINGKMPVTHGVSYYCARQQMKEAGEVMGLDLLVMFPDVPYAVFVEKTRNLD